MAPKRETATMGHTLLGTLPDTRPWRRVVANLAEGDDVAVVAAATAAAADRGLTLARFDEGLRAAFWLLTRLVLASCQPPFSEALRRAGIDVPDHPNVFDLAAGFSSALDRELEAPHCRTDLGEMAQLAAVESLTRLLGQRSARLFETTHEEVEQAVRDLATPAGFACLAHDFFTRFAQRFLTYHLGRELSNHVGGNGRFASPAEHNRFVDDLATHCREAAAIMRGYAEGWFAKRCRRGDFTVGRARRFVDYAVEKIQAELRLRGARDGH